MKKTAVFILAALMALSLGACGTASTASSGNRGQNTGSTASVEAESGQSSMEAQNAEDQKSSSDEKDAIGTSSALKRTVAKDMTIRIRYGKHQVTAQLYDNSTAKALYSRLPIKIGMTNLYNREISHRYGTAGLPGQGARYAKYQVGDIVYRPSMGSLTIFYNQTGEEVQQIRIGHTDEDLSFLRELSDKEITLEKVES